MRIRSDMWTVAIPAVMIAMSAPCHGLGEYYSFAQWERLSPEIRDAYLAGAIDAMLSDHIDEFEAALSERYKSCLLRSKVTTSQMSEALLRSVAIKPNLRGDRVLSAVTDFIRDLCPDLLSTDALADLIAKLSASKAR
jgi:hypothetical protein